MKAIQIINDAYIFSNVIAEEGQDLTSVQVRDGARLLNFVINNLNKDGDVIALNSQETLTIPKGQTTLILNDYIRIDKVQFNLGSVWIDIQLNSAQDFYNQAVISTVNSIPYYGYVKRTAEGVELIVYFTPEKDYDIRIVSGVKKIVNLQPDDDLTADSIFYEELLIWKLANYIRVRNQMPRDPAIDIEIRSISRRLKNIKPININTNLSKVGSCNTENNSRQVMKTVADANIMGGFRP
jgi:hypothetical protein